MYKNFGKGQMDLKLIFITGISIKHFNLKTLFMFPINFGLYDMLNLHDFYKFLWHRRNKYIIIILYFNSEFEFSSNQLNKKWFTSSHVLFLFNIEKLQWECLVHLNILLVIELTPSIFSMRNLCGRGHSLIDQGHTSM